MQFLEKVFLQQAKTVSFFFKKKIRVADLKDRWVFDGNIADMKDTRGVSKRGLFNTLHPTPIPLQTDIPLVEC